MIKHKKFIASLISVFLLLNTAVFAQSTALYAENGGSDVVKISGESETANVVVTCTVYKDKLSQKKIYEFSDEEKAGVYANQKLIDSNSYSFDFTPRGGSGKYVYYVNFSKSDTPVTGKFSYVTQSDRAYILALATDETKTGDDIKKEIKNGIDTKFSHVSEIFSVLDDDAKLKVGNAIAATKDYTTYEGVIADINYYSVISSFLQDFNVQTLKDNADKIFGEDLTEYKIFEKEDDDFASKTIARLKDANAETFISEFAMAVYLTQIECAGNVTEIYDIMTAIKNRTDIDVDNYFELNSTSALDNEIIGKSFTEVTLEAKVAAAKDVVENSVSRPGSSGGGKGTGYSGGMTTSVIVTNPKTEVTTPDNTNDNVVLNPVFEDMDLTHWAYEMVEALYKNGIVSGDGNGRFNAENTITREEFTKLVTVAFELESDAAECSFEDVAPDMWSYKYIASAYAKGIISGKSELAFEPYTNITREEAAHILCNIIDAKSYVVEKEREYQSFSDEELISDYAVSDIKLLYGAKIINGYNDNTFGAKNSITRAEGAAMIFNMLKKIR